ncbi:MAG: radical SAM family heme chaperone HemW [Acidobacteriota bacterium]|nr:radical SAM family heme chaperone HemW [Acidobacteriota bacterium]
MYDAATAERYVGSLVKEIESWREVENVEVVDTIYLGGGTPSLLTPAQLETTLAATRQRFNFPVSPHAEITMEMNPGTVTPETLAGFRGLGVNRASFGAQTFDDGELSRLGRSHTADDTRRTFRYLRDAGFDNVSFDLIAGLPGQTLDGWTRNLEEAFSLRPEHLSFYLLEVHQGTPLAEHIRRGIQPRPDEDLAAEMYELMLDRAGEAGYEHYEISNLCLPGFQSRHNTKYWTGAPYYSFGCSAHSYDGMFRRWANERDLMSYMAAIDHDCSPIASKTQLTEGDRRSESVFLGLRMMQGFNLSDYQKLFGADLRKEYEDDLTRFSQAGLIECTGDLLKLTRAGALLSNEVFSAFV